MYRIHWLYRLVGILMLFAFFSILAYCMRPKTLGPDQPDNDAQEYREHIGQKYGQEAFDRLTKKYGNQ